MPTKYKLYTVEENTDKIYEEYYSKSELDKYKLDPNEDINLFECAERMIHKFNRKLSENGSKRYCYKLEKVTVQVIGKEAYYGLNISPSMCKPEFR